MAEVNFLVKKGLTVPKGSASTPSVIFDASDPNTGLYSPGADQVAVATNGAGRVFVDASGRIGIAGSPSASSNTYLQVGYAGIGSDHVAYNYDSYFANNLYKSANSAWSRISTRAGGLLRIEDDTFTYSTADSGTAGASATLSERLRITSAGLVGIGTSSPGANLQITRTGGDNDDIVRIGQSQGYYLGIARSNTTGAFSFQGNQVGANNILLAPTSGNVGIGVTGPGSKLEVGGEAAPRIGINATGTGTTGLLFQGAGTTYGSIIENISSGELAIKSGASGQNSYFITFGTNDGTERARIDFSGRLLVGTTSAQGSAILQTDSTTLGFLPPRMTTAQRDAISSPAAGLMVYNTSTNKLNFYNGTAWEAVTSA